MPAANYNFPIEQGTDFGIDFIYRDENGNLVDLSNSCVVFQFRFDNDNICNKYVLSSLANSNYDTDNWSLVSDSSGNIKIRIAAELTKNFSGSAVYDLDIISSASNLRNIRLSTGIITIISRNFSNLPYCPSNLEICFETPELTSTGPTITGSGNEITPTPTVESQDLCLPYDCLDLDIYSSVYNGSGLILSDISEVSGSVITTATGLIENIELAINGLNHTNPSDIQLLLSPPSGNKILLSANHKIPAYSGGNFSFMFSNKASSGKYLHNCVNGDSINIYNKTSYVNYNDETLASNFDHLFNNSITGVWTLISRDTDPTGSGSIVSWNLIITQQADVEQ